MIKLTVISKILQCGFILILCFEKGIAQEICFFDKRMVFEDFYSTFPGECIYNNRKSISFFYSIPFGLKDLSTKSLDLVLSMKNSIRFEGFFSDFGSDKYSEKKTGISLSKNFGKYIALGISYNFNFQGRYLK